MATFEPNNEAIEELLTGPTGPVYRLVSKLAEDTLELAREFCPVGEDGGGQMRDRLRIDAEVISPGRGISVRIITDPVDPDNGFHYALVAHEGHGVLHAKEGGLMKFNWPAQNRWVSTDEVSATEGTPFLTKALDLANLANGEQFLLEPGDESGPVG